MSAIRSFQFPVESQAGQVFSSLNDPGELTEKRLDDAEALLQHFEQIEERFENLRQHLTRSHRLTTLGTLASIIAHEYNNILTPMVSYAQMALADPDNAPLMRKAIEKSLTAAERAAKVSDSLLGFSRETDGRTTAPLRDTLDEAVATLARPPQRDGITLTIDVPKVDLAIDPLSLQQILVNLLLNACKAMRRTGGAIRITGEIKTDRDHQHEAASPTNHKEQRHTRYFRLQIADTGPGIPADIRDRLFEPFVTRATESNDRDEKGTGLGLCICRDLVTSAGGSIHAESIPEPQPDHGATFSLELPLAEPKRHGDSEFYTT